MDKIGKEEDEIWHRFQPHRADNIGSNRIFCNGLGKLMNELRSHRQTRPFWLPRGLKQSHVNSNLLSWRVSRHPPSRLLYIKSLAINRARNLKDAVSAHHTVGQPGCVWVLLTWQQEQFGQCYALNWLSTKRIDLCCSGQIGFMVCSKKAADGSKVDVAVPKRSPPESDAPLRWVCSLKDSLQIFISDWSLPESL